MADKSRTILFTADAVYQTVPPERFKQGEVRTMRDDLALRWIGRGVATDDAAAVAAAKAGKPVEVAKTIERLPDGVPANWRTLTAREAIALATGALKARVEDVQTRSHAMGVIEAAVAEANKPASA